MVTYCRWHLSFYKEEVSDQESFIDLYQSFSKILYNGTFCAFVGPKHFSKETIVINLASRCNNKCDIWKVNLFSLCYLHLSSGSLKSHISFLLCVYIATEFCMCENFAYCMCTSFAYSLSCTNKGKQPCGCEIGINILLSCTV